MKPRKKAFDCLEMKRRGQKHVRELIAGMSPEEELEFWRRETEAARREQAEIVARLKKSG